MSKEIFRNEVLDNKKSKTWEGDIALPNTFSLKIFIFALLFILTAILFFLVLGSYTERRTVSGYLTPVKGIVKITAPSSGTIEYINVEENQYVELNDELITIRNDVYGNEGDYDTQIKENLNDRLTILSNQNALINRTYDENKNIINANISDLEERLIINSAQINNVMERISSVKNKYNKYANVAILGAISELELQVVKDEISTLNFDLYGYQEARSLIQSQLKAEALRIKQLQAQEKKELNELTLQKEEVKQSLIEIDKQKTIIVKAPVSGEITALNIHPSQIVDKSSLLFNILPNNSVLKANLLIPPRDIGFIKIGQEVSLRYDAFPFEKYGQAKGKISSISKTTISPSDLLEIGGFSVKDNTNSTFYLVDVTIQEQSFLVDGNRKMLNTGMTLSADIILENRKLYQWILEPLISLKERNN